MPTNLALTAADLNAEIETLLAHYRAYKADGWSTAEIYEFTTKAVASLVRLVGEYDPSADDLKATVLAAFARLYDDVIAPIDIPYVPNVIETRFLDPALKTAMLKQVAGMIDGLLSVFRGAATPPPAPQTPAGWQPY